MLSVSPKPAPGDLISLHATTVAAAGKALVLCGPAGSGKSSLALQMLALGGTLVADDVTWLGTTDRGVEARCPPNLEGQIEARGFGVLRAPAHGPALVAAVLDLAQSAEDRIPSARTVTLLGQSVPLFHKPQSPACAEIFLHYLRFGLHPDRIEE